MPYRKPAPITEQHVIDGFDSGKPPLDEWLKDMALYNQAQGYTRTFVVADEHHHVVGYHSLCAGMIHRTDVSRGVKGSKAPAELPVAVLARLAVTKEHQGVGLGPALLKNALMSVVSAAQLVAFRGVIVHAIDDDAMSFYKKFEFQETKGMDRRLILPARDIVASLAKVTG
ncbi:GNAT family N-acetyltransferase [Mesorhizobium sp. M7A.F.Ca.US.002.01.1.1]|uniref:GNAT family N-acetyltransferase n=1 Tax=Mesorhizobium sp. M7A.F.Ca.US.002.01.1.1 TaxID=2496700 RepID=UPI001FE23DDD|nr:GNAT family N-acetyltransferase [Mesorhizobium sp. M7A.F.Ca.US.002.01.1.1]